METYGYMGKIIFLDLHSGQYHIEKLDPDFARAGIGGQGLNTLLMEKTFRNGTDPLSPDNCLIFGVGPLVNSGVQGASKTLVTTRYPQNGAISESVGSMRFASNLKGAGFDHMIVTGKAKKPVILVIEDERISMVNANGLWGLTIRDTTEKLKNTYGEKSGVIAIGPAGENGIPFAVASVDQASTLGRGGLGAVLGSKNVKAVVAIGGNRPKIYDLDQVKGLIGEMRERLKKFEGYKRLLDLGFMEGWDLLAHKINYMRSFTEVMRFEKADELYGVEVVKNTFKRTRLGCPSCVTPDKDSLEIMEGPFKGFQMSTSAYINSFIFGQMFDLNKPNDKTASVRFLARLDDMGVDMFTFGRMLDFLMTECEEGRLPGDSFDLPLTRDMDNLSRWLDAIVYRKGSGDILAEGWASLLDYLGKEFRVRAPIVKNTEILYDPRLVGLGTMEFEQIVSMHGPRSGAGGSLTFVTGLTEESLPLFARHLDRMGAREDAIKRIMESPLGFNVGRMTRYSEDWFVILSSLGICNRHFNNRFFSLDLCNRLFNAVTGFQIDKDEMRDTAVKIWDTLRMLNQREGFSPADDKIPEIWFKPMKGPDGEALVLTDYFRKTKLGPEDLSELLKDYYDERGWPGGVAGPSNRRVKREKSFQQM
jgi:aldehyde:ferredoxin oxidoreductase